MYDTNNKLFKIKYIKFVLQLEYCNLKYSFIVFKHPIQSVITLYKTYYLDFIIDKLFFFSYGLKFLIFNYNGFMKIYGIKNNQYLCYVKNTLLPPMLSKSLNLM